MDLKIEPPIINKVIIGSGEIFRPRDFDDIRYF